MSTTIRRTALSIAGLALAAGSLTACGGDDDADTAGGDSSASASPSESTSDTASESPSTSAPAGGDASTKDFCGVYAGLFEQVIGVAGQGGDVSSIVPQLKKYADQLEEVGPPDDIPADAKKGFEVSIEAIKDLPDDATEKDLEDASSSYSAEDQAAAQTFGQYVVTACPELMSAVPTPTPAS